MSSTWGKDGETMFPTHHRAVRTMCLCPNGPLVTGCSSDVVLWSGKDILHRFGGHSEDITSVACNDEVIVSASKDGTVRVWEDVGEHFGSSRIMSLGAPVESVAISSEGIVATHSENVISLWNVDRTVNYRIPREPSRTGSSSISFSTDGRLVCTDSGMLIDVAIGERAAQLPEGTDVKFSSPNILAIASDESMVIDIRDRNAIRRGPPSSRIAWCKQTVGCLYEGELCFWDLDVNQQKKMQVRNGTCISGDERSFVVGDEDGYVHTWGEMRGAKAGSTRARIALADDVIDTGKLPEEVATVMNDVMTSLRAVSSALTDITERMDMAEMKLEFLSNETVVKA